MIVAIFVVVIILIRFGGTSAIPEETVAVKGNRYQKYSCIETLRELTMIYDFPTFDSEVYEYKMLTEKKRYTLNVYSILHCLKILYGVAS